MTNKTMQILQYVRVVLRDMRSQDVATALYQMEGYIGGILYRPFETNLVKNVLLPLTSRNSPLFRGIA